MQEQPRGVLFHWVANMFFAGVALFSGSLKILTIAGPQWKWLGMVAPIGGLAMIAGWIALAVGAFRKG